MSWGKGEGAGAREGEGEGAEGAEGAERCAVLTPTCVGLLSFSVAPTVRQFLHVPSDTMEGERSGLPPSPAGTSTSSSSSSRLAWSIIAVCVVYLLVLLMHQSLSGAVGSSSAVHLSWSAKMRAPRA